MTEKYCPKCEKTLPFAAFRSAKRKNHKCEVPGGCAQDFDSYCRGCRRKDAVTNRERENARYRRYTKRRGYVPKDPVKVNARAAARRAHETPKRCTVKRCSRRGERHHYLGYLGEAKTAIQWLCRTHHALEHVLARARERTEPAYF